MDVSSNHSTANSGYFRIKLGQNDGRWGAFPWKLAGLSLTALASGHALSLELWDWLTGAGVSPILLGVISSVLFLAAALKLYRERLSPHPPVVFLVLAVVAGHWLAVLSHHEMKSYTTVAHAVASTRPAAVFTPWTWLVLAIFFAGSLIWLHQIRHSLKRIRTLSRYKMINNGSGSRASDFVAVFQDGESETGSRGQDRRLLAHITDLIVPLSAPSVRPAILNGQVVFAKTPAASVALEGVDLGADIRRLDEMRPNWQQLLRAIAPHAGRITRLWLVGSRGLADDPAIRKPPGVLTSFEQEQQGSFGFIEDAIQMLKPYLPNCTFIPVDVDFIVDSRASGRQSERGVVFSDTKRLLHLMEAIISRAGTDRLGNHESNTIIDTTGGQKTTSIVGAALTLNDASLFQYVDTGTGEVLVYDIRLENPPEFH